MKLLFYWCVVLARLFCGGLIVGAACRLVADLVGAVFFGTMSYFFMYTNLVVTLVLTVGMVFRERSVGVVGVI